MEVAAQYLLLSGFECGFVPLVVRDSVALIWIFHLFYACIKRVEV